MFSLSVSVSLSNSLSSQLQKSCLHCRQLDRRIFRRSVNTEKLHCVKRKLCNHIYFSNLEHNARLFVQTGRAEVCAVRTPASRGSVPYAGDRNSIRTSVLGSCMLHKLDLAEHNLAQPRTWS